MITFHGTKYLIDIEWWYFDAVFENGYSVHIGFRIYHIKNRGLLQTRINIYQKGKLITEKIKRSLFDPADFNTEKPIIHLDNKTVLSFSIDKEQPEKPWIYSIDLGIDDVDLRLSFIGKTPGWKIETKTTCWTAPLPLASVQGHIVINDKKMKQYHIPQNFEIKIQEKGDSDQTQLNAHLEMKTIDVHYDRIFIIHYWRYHVETKGIIQYGNHVEKIENKPQIIEYLRFKKP